MSLCGPFYYSQVANLSHRNEQVSLLHCPKSSSDNQVDVFFPKCITSFQVKRSSYKMSINTVSNCIQTWIVSYLVPNSANKNARRCLGWRCNLKRKWNNINHIVHGNLTKLLKTSLSSLFCNYSAVRWILAQFVKLWNEDIYDTICLHFKAHKTILHFIYKYIHTGKCL